MARFMMKHADLIVTHAREGIEVIRGQYPPAVTRTIFLHHPTKNRISNRDIPSNPESDLLIWGTITRYKGVLEFVRFAIRHHWDLRIKIIGRCASVELQEELEQVTKGHPYITFEDPQHSFRGIGNGNPESPVRAHPLRTGKLLSSGILMDSCLLERKS